MATEQFRKGVTVAEEPEKLKWKRQIYSGICRCGHSWQDHHHGFIMNEDILAQLPDDYPPYIAQECEYYGCNEDGGLGPDLENHCHRYVDKDDPERKTYPGPGTFTVADRALAWVRWSVKAFRILVLRQDRKKVWAKDWTKLR